MREVFNELSSTGLAEVDEGSLTDYILNSKGMESLEDAITGKEGGIPLEIAMDLTLVDLLNCDKNTKEKIFGYRLWMRDPSFSLIKGYLPEGAIRLDDVYSLLDDDTEAGVLNERIADIDEITVMFLSDGGGVFIKRYKLMAEVIKEELDNGYSREEVLARKIEIADRFRKKERQNYLERETSRNKDRYARKKALVDEAENFLASRIKFYPEGKTNILELSEETDISIEILEKALKTRFTHDRRAEFILRQLHESNLDGLYSIRSLAREYKIKRNCFFSAKKRLRENGIHIRKNQRINLIKEALRLEITRAGGLNKSLSQFAQDNGFSKKGVLTAVKSLREEEPELFI